MLVADGDGLPIGFYLESANHHEAYTDLGVKDLADLCCAL